MLAATYGISGERVSQQLADVAGKLVADYWDNNSGDILDIVDGSFLMDYDEAGQEFQFKSAAAISILYTVLERCGLEPDGHFDRDDFQAMGGSAWATWTQTGWPRVICRQHSTFTARRTPSTANSSSSMM